MEFKVFCTLILLRFLLQFLADKDAVLASSALVDSARSLWEGYRQDVMEQGGAFNIDDISAVVVFF